MNTVPSPFLHAALADRPTTFIGPAQSTPACMMTLPREVYESILQDVDLPVLSCLHLGLLGLKYPG